MTQLIKQYGLIKAKYPDAIVQLRIDDTYETFNEDAKLIAKHLSVILTEPIDNPGLKAAASLPFHAIDVALKKLVKAGYRVAICDQLEDPKMAKGILKRNVTDII